MGNIIFSRQLLMIDSCIFSYDSCYTCASSLNIVLSVCLSVTFQDINLIFLRFRYFSLRFCLLSLFLFFVRITEHLFYNSLCPFLNSILFCAAQLMDFVILVNWTIKIFQFFIQSHLTINKTYQKCTFTCIHML